MQNRFLRQQPLGYLGFLIKMISALFLSTSHHNASYLGFLTEGILAIFYLQVTLKLLTKFHVNWLFSLGEEVKDRFQIQRLWRPSCISNLNDLSYF